MGAATVLKMATIWGAKLLGLEKEIGTIEVGKKADIITVDLRKPHLVPLYNPISTIVYSACGSDVKDVIVNGQGVDEGPDLHRPRCGGGDGQGPRNQQENWLS